MQIRKQTGARFDENLVKELKRDAISADISYEDLLNKVLWDYLENKYPELKPKQLSNSGDKIL